MGTKNACLTLEEQVAEEILRKGCMRIGWTICKASRYEARYKCFNCGQIGHTRVQCRSKVKLCYACGNSGHDASNCREKQKRPVEVIEEGRRENMEILITNEIRRMEKQLGIEAGGGSETIEDRNKKTRTIATQTEEASEQRTWAERVGRKELGTGLQVLRMEGKRNTERKEVNTKKGAAVLIKMGKSYEETIGVLKSKVGSPKGIKIDRVRKTRTGAVLFEMGSAEEAAKWEKEVKKKVEKEITIIQLRERDGIKIRGIDGTMEKEEIRKAIANEIGVDRENEGDIEIARLITEPWSDKTALVKLPKRAADELCDRGKIRIGWTFCRITRMSRILIRCWKCGRYGHGSFSLSLNN
ncbi:hypothetical protein WH47_04904 [Habropoda laboriosa]|uniref:CCHC-type domain-containing protein n=1 Tax=Habropoda laboriosa TaxID=597456 RepID=A0A0L7QWS5_9HYME|nr:hypothetical protein WH47_04904 [Habropoda laboriosa]